MGELSEWLRAFLRSGPWTPLLVRLKRLFVTPTSQNGEDAVLARLAQRYDAPRLFVELGYGGWEFNCASLAEAGWGGLLVDNDQYSRIVATTLYSPKVETRRMWVNLDNIAEIARWVDGRPLGVLSIDVDGNDYWFLDRLLALRPAIICCEYNSAIGMRSLTVPYDAGFFAYDKGQHPHYNFQGASLAALVKLAEAAGYRLVEQLAGINAFFVRDDLIDNQPLPSPDEIYEPRLVEQWAELRDLPWEKV